MKRSEVSEPRRPMSFWEFQLRDYDSGRPLTQWRRTYQTRMLLRTRLFKTHRSNVTQMPAKVYARRPGDPNSETVVPHDALRVRGSKFFHHVEFPRRTGSRK